MKTHFHLVVETPRANLVPGMKWLLSTYTIRFNRRHKVFGHQAAAIGADEGKAGAGAFWGGGARIGDGQSGESGPEGVEAVGLGRKGVNRPTEGGPRESAPGDALEAEHNHDHRLDRGAVTDGDARACIASVVLGRQNQA